MTRVQHDGEVDSRSMTVFGSRRADEESPGGAGGWSESGVPPAEAPVGLLAGCDAPCEPPTSRGRAHSETAATNHQHGVALQPVESHTRTLLASFGSMQTPSSGRLTPRSKQRKSTCSAGST